LFQAKKKRRRGGPARGGKLFNHASLFAKRTTFKGKEEIRDAEKSGCIISKKNGSYAGREGGRVPNLSSLLRPARKKELGKLHKKKKKGRHEKTTSLLGEGAREHGTHLRPSMGEKEAKARFKKA